MKSHCFNFFGIKCLLLPKIIFTLDLIDDMNSEVVIKIGKERDITTPPHLTTEVDIIVIEYYSIKFIFMFYLFSHIIFHLKDWRISKSNDEDNSIDITTPFLSSRLELF
jgi:hypothetical protein